MNPNNYGSLPACKRLAEVLARKGRAIETGAAYYHVYQPVDNAYKWVLCLREGRMGTSLQYDEEVPAYSMAEGWRELPDWIKVKYDRGAIHIWKSGKVTECGYFDIAESYQKNTNPTDALIELWIWVLEQEEASHDTG